jgi:hypothetical protein
MTPTQLRMLIDCADGEPTDFADYCKAGTLAWRNRERVLDALIRKGLLDDNLKVTEKGRQYLPGN